MYTTSFLYTDTAFEVKITSPFSLFALLILLSALEVRNAWWADRLVLRLGAISSEVTKQSLWSNRERYVEVWQTQPSQR